MEQGREDISMKEGLAEVGIPLIRSRLEIGRRVQIMGVLNLTPDSFSDGGLHLDPDRAVARALEMEAEGADLLDLGGESTRPGAPPISLQEEAARVLPVLDRLRGQLQIPISIDTTKMEIARDAIALGAEIINDVSGLRADRRLAELAATTGAGLILMHSRATPATMHLLPPLEDLEADLWAALEEAIQVAQNAGVARRKLLLDPGIGFGKTPDQNLWLIHHLPRLLDRFMLPVLLGPSRKSFIPRTLDRVMSEVVKRDLSRERLAGTVASLALGVARGAKVVRVHDVAESLVAVRLTEAILATGAEAPPSP
jgi:dihydropteroate synthase